MEFLHELFLTACMAAVFSLIVGVSIALSGGEEKSSVEEVKVEKKGLKAVGGKSKKKVKFVDDVVVRDVDRFDYELESSKDVNLVKRLDGILGNRLEEEILSRDEVKIVKVADKVENQRKDEKSEETVSGGEIVEEYGNMNVVSKLEHADVVENVLEVVGPIDKVMEKEMEEEKVVDVKVGEFKVEGNSLEELAAIDEMKREIVSETGLEAVDVHLSVDQKNVEFGEGDSTSALLFSETLEEEAVEERSTEKVFDTADAVKKTKILAVDGDLEKLFSGENSRSQDLGEEICAVDGGLKNSSIEENSRSQATSEDIPSAEKDSGNFSAGENRTHEPLGEDNEVELLNNYAFDENEDGGGVRVRGKNEIGIKKDLVEMSQVKESRDRVDDFGKDEEKGDDNDNDDDDDDDWEGIERSELEKVFAEAVNYVEYGGKGKDDQCTRLGSDVQMQLYGLHKLAVEGSCYEPQPMALKMSARAKWNAWQRLGSMSPELAMEQYIKLLSETDPDWTYHAAAGDGKDGYIESGADGVPDTKSSMIKEVQDDNEEHGRYQVSEHKA